jgi:hypothetical protein
MGRRAADWGAVADLIPANVSKTSRGRSLIASNTLLRRCCIFFVGCIGMKVFNSTKNSY